MVYEVKDIPERSLMDPLSHVLWVLCAEKPTLYLVFPVIVLSAMFILDRTNS